MNRQRRQIIDHPSLRKKEEVDLWEGERRRERKEERDTNQKSGSRKITIGENNNNNENLIRNDGYFLFLYGAPNWAGESSDKKSWHLGNFYGHMLGWLVAK